MHFDNVASHLTTPTAPLAQSPLLREFRSLVLVDRRRKRRHRRQVIGLVDLLHAGRKGAALEKELAANCVNYRSLFASLAQLAA